jgi:hypothetical protein
MRHVPTGYEVDYGSTLYGLAVEFQGVEPHARRGQFLKDRRRIATIQDSGVLVVEVPSWDFPDPTKRAPRAETREQQFWQRMIEHRLAYQQEHYTLPIPAVLVGGTEILGT